MRNAGHPSGRQRLIEAALISLAEHGYHRSSVRKITETAGVTPGLLRHYFDGKAELLVESYRHFKRSALDLHLDEAAKAGTDPIRQLETFTRSILFFNDVDRKQMNIWVSFLESVITNTRISAVQAENYDRSIGALSVWITRIHAGRGEHLSPDQVRRLAIGVYSVIDGVWLECSLDPLRMTPEEALNIALDMIGARLDITFATFSGR